MADEPKPVEGEEKKEPTEPDKPLSMYEKTEAIVERQEKANKKREELIEREEKLFANQRLAGTAGGRVEPTPAKEETPAEYNARIEKEISEGKHDD